MKKLAPYLFIALSLCLLSSKGLADTNSCPMSSYLGGGLGHSGSYPNLVWANFTVSFPNGVGSMTSSAQWELDADANFPTCNPNTWSTWSASPMYGNVTYNDGTVAYTGKVRIWLHVQPAPTPYCVYNGKTYDLMVSRLKIQSCTNSGNLTNRFFAVSCDGYYCAQQTGGPCDTNYLTENWLNLTVSGF